MKRNREEHEAQTTVPKEERSIIHKRGNWLQGEKLGKGGFGSVHMARFPVPTAPYFKNFPPMAAVKSSKQLVLEKSALNLLRDCPSVVRCLGEDITITDHMLLHNVFLEYAAGGTLPDFINHNNSKGPGLLEPQVKL